MNVSGSSDSLLLRLLDASTERQKTIATNLANQSTPGYRRKLVVFEDHLAAAMERGRSLDAVEPSIEDDITTPTRSDGNNVTPELERVADEENRLRYETYATILQGHYGLLQRAITGQ